MTNPDVNDVVSAVKDKYAALSPEDKQKLNDYTSYAINGSNYLILGGLYKPVENGLSNVSNALTDAVEPKL
jgi:hypothetical protein